MRYLPSQFLFPRLLSSTTLGHRFPLSRTTSPRFITTVTKLRIALVSIVVRRSFSRFSDNTAYFFTVTPFVLSSRAYDF
jgi:hypothetical protein